MDLDKYSMAVIVGQYKIDGITARSGRGDAFVDIIVEYSVDHDKRHGREYTAVVVPLTAGFTFKTNSESVSLGRGARGAWQCVATHQ